MSQENMSFVLARLAFTGVGGAVLVDMLYREGVVVHGFLTKFHGGQIDKTQVDDYHVPNMLLITSSPYLMFVLYLVSSAERDYCLHLAASEYVRK